MKKFEFIDFLNLVYDNIKTTLAIIALIGTFIGFTLSPVAILGFCLLLSMIVGIFAIYNLFLAIPNVAIFYGVFIAGITYGATVQIGFSAILLGLILIPIFIAGILLGLAIALPSLSLGNLLFEVFIGDRPRI